MLKGVKDYVLILQKSCTPMNLKMNYTSFKDLIEVWFSGLCFYIDNLVLNDFCEIFKCFIYSFIDIKTWVNNC
jgi:hypothetical protein